VSHFPAFQVKKKFLTRKINLTDDGPQDDGDQESDDDGSQGQQDEEPTTSTTTTIDGKIYY